MKPVLLIFFFTYITSASTATYDHVTQCSGTTALGESNPYSFTDNIDTDTGAVLMVEDVNFQVKCCGVLSYWEINARVLASIDLQVWRRTTTSYELVGFNTVTPTTSVQNVLYITATGHHIYPVPTADRISVKHGDYIGWFSATTEVISYNSGTGYPIMNRKKTGETSFAVGDTLNWASEAVASGNRQYAIGAQVVAGDTPTFNIGTNYATTVDESAALGATVVTLSVVDDDSLDTHTVNVLSTENGYFELDQVNLVIKTLQAEIPEAVYIMQLQVIDDCYLSSTSTVTITVQNTGITINNLPVSLSVREDLFQQQNLLDLDITEATDGWYCDMEDTNTVPFVTRQVDAASGPEYGIYLNDWPQLDFDTKSLYLLKIHCYDDEHTASNTATVTVVKNSDPTFTNLDNTVTIDAKSVVNSEVIFTVSVTDAEDDQIIFTMTTSPTGGPFDILDSGKVVMTSNVLRHHASASYELSITADDGYNTVGPRTLTVSINDINDKPEITNLPADINIIENQPLSKSLYNVTVDDLDVNDTLLYTATFDPPEAVKYFNISTSGQWAIVSTSDTHNIDFDILTDISIEMYIMVTDGKEHDEEVLAIQIQNQNEEPVFSQTHYSITRDEGASGLQFPLTRYNVRDPDSGDTHTYLLDCGTNTSRLSINTATGRISFSGEYDLDTAGTPTDFSCTVNITDYDGLHDSCEIAVNIRYVNEYTPTFPFAEYDLTVYFYEIIGTIKITITATDLDLTDHGTFYYTLTQTFSGGVELFGVLSNGSMYIKDDLTSYGAAGATFDVLMLATDTGGLVGTATIHITIPMSVDAVTTTEAPFSYLENIVNTALLAACVLGGIVVLVLIGYIVRKYFNPTRCQRPSCDCCKRTPKPIPPLRPPTPKPMSPPPRYTPQEVMPLPKPIQLQEPGEERVAVSGDKINKKRQNSKEERIYEKTYHELQSRDVNRWIEEVEDDKQPVYSWDT